MPTLRQLRALGLIAQTGSFTKAAERLHITQSAVSILMRELEDEVGQPLIQRGRSIRLTDAGEHLHHAGSRASQEVERALQEIRQSRHLGRTVLRVAAGSLSAATLMPAALARMRSGDSGLQVALIDRPVGMLGHLLLSGEADLAIGSIDSPLHVSDDLRSTLLFSDELSVVCARGNALAVRAQCAGGLAWADLAQSKLILVGRNGGQWNSLLQDQLALHEQLEVGYEVQLFSTAIELVRYDLGVAVLPRLATRLLEASAFCASPLLNSSARWNTYSVVRKDAAPRGAAAEVFLEALRLSIDDARPKG